MAEPSTSYKLRSRFLIDAEIEVGDIHEAVSRNTRKQIVDIFRIKLRNIPRQRRRQRVQRSPNRLVPASSVAASLEELRCATNEFVPLGALHARHGRAGKREVRRASTRDLQGALLAEH